MPRKYKRSVTAPSRAAWSEEQLREAIEKVSTNKISAREAHRRYGVFWEKIMRKGLWHISSVYRQLGLHRTGNSPYTCLQVCRKIAYTAYILS
ncbi:hypothetical protein NQ318_023524 [Aromia moschata]|uniref:Transposase n=1 Tax=Aromia moschata TaxID=1265417 RepID=A0AAV8YRW6_9CUCU|nr:hypothetical protein NQ318_023524 [Aromia moschata]